MLVHRPKHQKFHSCKHFCWSPEEDHLNQVFTKIKLAQEQTLPSNFFQRNTTKHIPLMKTKTIYSLLETIPKGVLHHLHADCNEDAEFIKKYVVPYPGIGVDSKFENWFFGTEEERLKGGFLTMEEARKLVPTESQQQFIDKLVKITQPTESQIEKHSYTEKVWDFFQEKISKFYAILMQQDILKNYLKHMLTGLINNGYDRVQLRTPLFPIKARDPTKTIMEPGVVKIYEQVEKQLKETYPFFSLGLIVFGLKMFSEEQLEKYLRMVYQIESHLVVGIDMVQQEDKFPEFKQYQGVIRKIQEEFKGKRTLAGVFHAGQTKRILNHNVSHVAKFGTRRIGHGINLFQHSYLIPLIKDHHNVLIQVCPLSNQFLNYVYNLTQHPAISFYHLGVPISINPDDPSRFGYNHVTPDYYVAVHAFGFNLKDLKLLGVYSVMYGIIEEEEKKVMLERFEKRWQEWMEFFRSKYDK